MAQSMLRMYVFAFRHVPSFRNENEWEKGKG